MLGQPLSMLIPAGRRLQADRHPARGRHRHRPRAHRHRDAAQDTASSASSSSSTARASPPLPLADRATIANMAPEYGATVGYLPRRRGDPDLPPLHRPRRATRSPWSRPTARSRASGTTRRRRARLHRHARARPRPPSSPRLAGPKRPQDRCRCPSRRVPQALRLRAEALDRLVDEARRVLPARPVASRPNGDGRPPTRATASPASRHAVTCRRHDFTSTTARSSSPPSPRAPTPPTRRS